jgi:hypothetical protein
MISTPSVRLAHETCGETSFGVPGEFIPDIACCQNPKHLAIVSAVLATRLFYSACGVCRSCHLLITAKSADLSDGTLSGMMYWVPALRFGLVIPTQHDQK